MIRTLLVSFLLLFTITAYSQNDKNSVTKTDFQIYLKQPAREIKHLMYEKNFLPIQGKLSEDRKSVILKNYEDGNKIRIKVIYDDGTEEEFTKSPCYIDPVIT